MQNHPNSLTIKVDTSKVCGFTYAHLMKTQNSHTQNTKHNVSLINYAFGFKQCFI